MSEVKESVSKKMHVLFLDKVPVRYFKELWE